MNVHKTEAATRAAQQAGLETEVAAPLAPHTSFGIGGPAAALCTARGIDELSRGLGAARQSDASVLVLGGGTNLLVSDEGWPGLALLLKLTQLEIEPDKRTVRVQASVKSAALVEATIEAGLAGLEFAAGLPGTVGGAVAGNAGCFGGSFGDRLIEAVIVLADGTVHKVRDPKWFAFSYRGSRLLTDGVVVAEATFALEPADRNALRSRADELRAVRLEKHPHKGTKTAGSYFKNLPALEPGGMRRAAGALLDAAGAKSMFVGDAAVFERHANIIINRGAASARDVLELADRMASAVRQTFGIELEPEVRFVGPRPISHQ